MSLTINHQLNDIINSTGTITINGVAAGGDNTPASFIGNRGLFAGGDTQYTPRDDIDYITIGTTGNATDFGNLSAAKGYLTSCGNGERVIFAGGKNTDFTVGTLYNTIEYITVGTTGNVTDFGDLNSTANGGVAVSNGVRGAIALGIAVTSTSNTIEYVTIATTGNATDFGDRTVAKKQIGGAGSLTRGLFAGGNATTNIIDYITISTTGNATDFGDLTAARGSTPAGCSNGTRALFGGGYESGGTSNIIDYVTIDTTGNATDFGDLTATLLDLASCANDVRGVWAGGNTTEVNVIQYVTIASTGNATDFGDLTAVKKALVGSSGD
jgi:hypothetical protein